VPNIAQAVMGNCKESLPTILQRLTKACLAFTIMCVCCCADTSSPRAGNQSSHCWLKPGPRGWWWHDGGCGWGSPADPHGNAQSDSKQDAAPATAKPASNHKTPHEAVKANQHAGGSNIRMGSDAQQKAEEAPPRKHKSGFMSKLKKPFGKS